ncbi:MAG: DUF2934 domain-containing protein [Nitrospirae bacterium]|nr:DUF2934 domain-containing protein [Nitrospirota bacterium]
MKFSLRNPQKEPDLKPVKTRSTKSVRKAPAPKQQQPQQPKKPPAQHPHPLPPSCCDSLQALIAKRAYELHLEREGRDGSPQNDWLVAEREILGQVRTV